MRVYLETERENTSTPRSCCTIVNEREGWKRERNTERNRERRIESERAREIKRNVWVREIQEPLYAKYHREFNVGASSKASGYVNFTSDLCFQYCALNTWFTHQAVAALAKEEKSKEKKKILKNVEWVRGCYRRIQSIIQFTFNFAPSCKILAVNRWRC